MFYWAIINIHGNIYIVVMGRYYMAGRDVLRALERNLGTGFQILREEPKPKGLYCPYGSSGECMGVNDLDYARCSSLNCENCFNYQLNEQQREMNEEKGLTKRRVIPLKASSPLRDTVIMSGDETVIERRPKLSSMPIDEAFDEELIGLPEVIEFAQSFRDSYKGADRDDHRKR